MADRSAAVKEELQCTHPSKRVLVGVSSVSLCPLRWCRTGVVSETHGQSESNCGNKVDMSWMSCDGSMEVLTE